MLWMAMEMIDTLFCNQYFEYDLHDNGFFGQWKYNFIDLLPFLGLKQKYDDG